MSDPTTEALAAFNDPSRWDRIVPRVPVFIAHERWVQDAPAADGTLPPPRKLVVDDARLQRIAANMKAQDDAGQPIVFHEGHTENPWTVPQSAQPDILSYGRQPTVGTWQGKKAILVTQYIPKGMLSRVQKLPFRSAEYQERKDNIPAVALLKTQPWLNMGVIFYTAPEAFAYQRGDALLLYMRDDSMPDPTTPPDAAAPDQEFESKVQGCVTKYLSDTYPHLGDMHSKYAAALAPPTVTAPAPAAPAANNTSPPAFGGKKPEEDSKPYGQTEITLQYQQLANEVTTLRGELKRVVTERNEERLNYSKSEATRLVQQLQHEGYVLPSPQKEVEKLVAMTPAQRAERVQEIRVCYQKDPTGDLIPLADLPASTAPVAAGRPLTREQRDQALNYMAEHNCTLEHAYEVVRGVKQ